MNNKILLCCATSIECENKTEICNLPIYVLGVGKLLSAYRLAQLIERNRPELVINFGSCGSYKHAVSTLLSIGISAQGDFDATPLLPMREEVPFEENSGSLHFNSESNHECITTDTFIHPDKHSLIHPDLLQRLKNADCFDMELYSYAKVCHDTNVKLLSYKWVSDDAENTDWVKNCQIGFAEFANLLKTELVTKK